jgi:DNA-directed RNA polymerase specialized sigma24 family protein
VGHAAGAEDLTAQALTEALEGLSRYRERGSFAAWLFAIAWRKAADHHRRRRPHLSLDEALDRPAESKDPLAGVLQHEALRRPATLVAGLDQEQLAGGRF